MVLSDIVAIGIIVLCLVIGLTTLKLLSRLLMGILLSFVVLACIGLLSENATFDRLSHGVFRQGIVVQYVKHKTVSTAQNIKEIERQCRSHGLYESWR